MLNQLSGKCLGDSNNLKCTARSFVINCLPAESFHMSHKDIKVKYRDGQQSGQ